MNGMNRKIVWLSIDKPDNGPGFRDYLFAVASVVLFLALPMAVGSEW